jgi:hypothetical protein
MTQINITTSVPKVLESYSDEDKRRLMRATKILIDWLLSQESFNSPPRDSSHTEVGTAEFERKETLISDTTHA